jgi:hypothetical protein
MAILVFGVDHHHHHEQHPSIAAAANKNHSYEEVVPFLTTFEMWAPFILLILTACGYGRVSSIVLSADSDGHMNLNRMTLSPKKSTSAAAAAAASSASSTVPMNHHHPHHHHHLNMQRPREQEIEEIGLIESEDDSQESGESDSDGGASSSSSDDDDGHENHVHDNALDENDNRPILRMVTRKPLYNLAISILYRYMYIRIYLCMHL